MSTKWTTNENPVASSKLNKLCIIHLTTADRTALVTADVILGQIIRDVTDGNYYEVSGTSPVTFKNLGKSLGGGGMFTKLFFGRIGRFIEPADLEGYVANDGIYPHDIIDQSGVNTTNIAQIESTSASTPFSDTREYRGTPSIGFNGKAVKKVIVKIPISIKSDWSVNVTNPQVTLKATTTKVEILNGATVKATITLSNDVLSSGGLGSAGSTALTHYIVGIADLADFVFTDFRIKVYIEHTASPTGSLTTMRHNWFGRYDAELGASITPFLAICEVELGN